MSKKPVIQLESRNYNGIEVVVVLFKSNTTLTEILRDLEGTSWSNSMKCWYIPADKFKLSVVFDKLHPQAFVDYSALRTRRGRIKYQDESGKKKTNNCNENVLPDGYLEKLEQKRYSGSTIRTYTCYFRDFMTHFDGAEMDAITVNEINGYILGLIRDKGISSSIQNQRINAIKFYYEKVLGREKQYYRIERPRKELKLPDVLSKQEIASMINNTKNLKHKCLLVMMYSCGLRRSEVIQLRLTDIDSHRMLVKIRGQRVTRTVMFSWQGVH